jgi:hypothetical protein
LEFLPGSYTGPFAFSPAYERRNHCSDELGTGHFAKGFNDPGFLDGGDTSDRRLDFHKPFRMWIIKHPRTSV